MNRKTAWITALCFVSSILNFATPAMAAEADLASLIQSLQKQMTELQSTVMAQKAELEALKKNGANIRMAPGNVEAAAPSMSEAEFKERLSGATGGADKWLKDLKFSGDLRLRYETFHLHGNTAANGYQPDRNRFRFRLRYGFEKKFNEEMKAGFALASGSSTSASGNTDPISTNQTFGNDFTFKNIWIEKAYATYTPDWAKVSMGDDLRVDGLEITAGKFNNPFEKGSTDMIWDRDLKPEGIYEKVDAYLLQTSDVKLKAYGILGQFVLQENGNTAVATGVGGKDAQLFAFQAGLNPIFYMPGMERPIDALSALSLYNYQGYATNNNWMAYPSGTGAFNNGNPINNGNAADLAAQNFNVLSFYQEVNLYPHGFPVKPFAEFARNMSNQSGVAGWSSKNSNFTMQGGEYAWSLGLAIGKLQKKGDWQASYQYKYIGANSVPGAFNDSDFGGYNYGGTNKDGSVIKLGYNLTDYLTLNGACFLVRPITQRDGTTNGMQADQSVRRFQMDLTWKF